MKKPQMSTPTMSLIQDQLSATDYSIRRYAIFAGGASGGVSLTFFFVSLLDRQFDMADRIYACLFIFLISIATFLAFLLLLIAPLLKATHPRIITLDEQGVDLNYFRGKSRHYTLNEISWTEGTSRRDRLGFFLKDNTPAILLQLPSKSHANYTINYAVGRDDEGFKRWKEILVKHCVAMS